MQRQMFNELRQQPLSHGVLQAIRHAIISGRLKPGEQLIQSQLAMQLGVSRAPLREALHKLEEEGLVVHAPYKGTIVAPLRLRDIEELRSLRTVIERYAAHLMLEQLTDADLAQLDLLYHRMRDAADRGDTEAFDEADLDIHTRICELSGHALLFEVWQLYATRFRRVLALRNSTNRDLHAVADMHLPLLETLRRRDRTGLDTFYDRHGADLTSVLTATWPEEPDHRGALRIGAEVDRD